MNNDVEGQHRKDDQIQGPVSFQVLPDRVRFQHPVFLLHNPESPCIFHPEIHENGLFLKGSDLFFLGAPSPVDLLFLSVCQYYIINLNFAKY